jgi:hypothetical protein
MGMGYGAGYADVVEEKFIKKICPKEYKAFLATVEGSEVCSDLEVVAREIEMGDTGDIVTKDVEKAYKALVTNFLNKTDLNLNIGFHDSDECGDRYDEVNGVYWSVGGVWKLTPAGKKYETQITRKFFVTFG